MADGRSVACRERPVEEHWRCMMGPRDGAPAGAFVCDCPCHAAVADEPMAEVVARVLRHEGSFSDGHRLAREVARLTAQADRHRVLIASLLDRADTAEAEGARLRAGIEAKAADLDYGSFDERAVAVELRALLVPAPGRRNYFEQQALTPEQLAQLKVLEDRAGG